jgi:enoyl-CoA hydratase/carnithine racemase
MLFVAAIAGHALGGGLELALACDFRFAARAEGVLIGLPEVRLGLLPGAGGTQRLTWLVGPARATELIMKGLQLSPEQAAADGIVHFLVEPDELEPKAQEYAVRLARQAPLALRGIKRAIRAAATTDGFAVEADAFREVLASEDAQRGVHAFLEGERPTFSGE